MRKEYAFGAEKKFETIIQTRPDLGRTENDVSRELKRGLLGGGKEGEGTATKMIRLRARPEAWTSYMSSRQYLRSCRRDLVVRRSAPIREQEIPRFGRAAIGNPERNDQCDRVRAGAAYQNSLDRNRRIESRRDISCQSSTAFIQLLYVRLAHTFHSWSNFMIVIHVTRVSQLTHED